MTITSAQLKKITPLCKDPEGWTKALNEIMPKYMISTPKQEAAFIAQCAHESGQFNTIQENLNYSAKGLRTVFGKYFPTDKLANEYQRQPEKIANRVYASRIGNGNEASGDGWRYRGRGAIQVTGKANYEAFAKSINKTLQETVAYLETKTGAVESAAWFWKTNDLNKFADSGDITKMTKKINGGTHGLQERMALYERAMQTVIV